MQKRSLKKEKNAFQIDQQYPTLNFYYKFNKLNNDVIVGSVAIYTAGNYPMSFSK